jgi:hypothetical protein
MATAKPTMAMKSGATKSAVKRCSSIFPTIHLDVETDHFKYFRSLSLIFWTSRDTGSKSYNFPRSHHTTRKMQALTPRAINTGSIAPLILVARFNHFERI